MPTLTLSSSLNVELNYSVDGDGDTTYLLFNGATLPLEFWGSLATSLAEYGRVIRFDQRNAGQTKFQGRFTLLDVAADAADLLAYLEVESVIAVGHAWGGRAAQVFVRDYPHLTRAIVICANGGQFPAVDMSEANLAAREARKKRDREAWDIEYERLWCAKGFAQRDPTTFKEMADLIWGMKINREARWNSQVSPSVSYWGTAKVPALLLYGDQDKNGTPQNAQDLHARLKGSRLVNYPDAGHYVIREKEADVLNEILSFERGLH